MPPGSHALSPVITEPVGVQRWRLDQGRRGSEWAELGWDLQSVCGVCSRGAARPQPKGVQENLQFEEIREDVAGLGGGE